MGGMLWSQTDRAPCPIEYQLPLQFVSLGPPSKENIGAIVEVFANNHLRTPSVEDIVTHVKVFANNPHMTAPMSHLLSGHSLLVAC